METWVDIKNYEGLYQVSNLGSVRRLPINTLRKNGKPLPLKGKVLKGTINAFGYRRYELSKNLITISFSGHRLVAIAFLLNPIGKPQINHINGIKDDNHVRNLEWCDNSENQKHAYKMGLNRPHALKGNKSNLSTHGENIAMAILNDLRKGLRNKDIAAKYNVSKSHVSSIKSKRIWAHIQTGNPND